MALIPFPNVPSLPGVPNLPRLPGGGSVLGIAGAVGAVLLLRNRQAEITPSKWLIQDSTGRALLEPDSVIGFDYRGESKISTFPVENGGFASYNKITSPFDVRIAMTCSGHGPMKRDAFLAKLTELKDALTLLTITTPDAVYKSLNLVQFDYRRTSRSGVSLLSVDAGFTEVRETGKATYSNVNRPDDASKVHNGTVQALPPTSQQIKQLDAKGVR